ncbi:hypothetical protein GMMP13_680003 [Candidatus Magnetomoraceae bacterium gMMP-13]
MKLRKNTFKFPFIKEGFSEILIYYFEFLQGGASHARSSISY